MVKALSVVTNVLLFVLFLGLAATVDVREFRAKFKAPRALIAGMCCQFGIVPALGFLSTQLFRLDAVLGVTLIIVCTSPGGSYSNWWCSIGNADLALSVAMTAISTLVSMVMMPMNAFIYIQIAYGSDVTLDWASLVVALLIAICAIGSGLYCGSTWPQKRGVFNGLGQVSGLVMIAISTIFSSQNDPIWNRDSAFYLATGLPCVGALLVSSVVAAALKLKKPETLAVVIETAYQNVGLATSIAVASVDDDAKAAAALGVPLFYGVLEAVLIALWCLVAHYLGWSYALPGTSLWTAAIRNFQPVTPEPVDEGTVHDDIVCVEPHVAAIQSRGRTSSATSSTASSPRQPYSPPTTSSPAPIDIAKPSSLADGLKKGEARGNYWINTPSSDPTGTPPTTPTQDSTDTQGGSNALSVAVPGAQFELCAELGIPDTREPLASRAQFRAQAAERVPPISPRSP